MSTTSRTYLSAVRAHTQPSSGCQASAFSPPNLELDFDCFRLVSSDPPAPIISKDSPGEQRTKQQAVSLSRCCGCGTHPTVTHPTGVVLRHTTVGVTDRLGFTAGGRGGSRVGHARNAHLLPPPFGFEAPKSDSQEPPPSEVGYTPASSLGRMSEDSRYFARRLLNFAPWTITASASANSHAFVPSREPCLSAMNTQNTD